MSALLAANPVVVGVEPELVRPHDSEWALDVVGAVPGAAGAVVGPGIHLQANADVGRVAVRGRLGLDGRPRGGSRSRSRRWLGRWLGRRGRWRRTPQPDVRLARRRF